MNLETTSKLLNPWVSPDRNNNALQFFLHVVISFKREPVDFWVLDAIREGQYMIVYSMRISTCLGW